MFVNTEDTVGITKNLTAYAHFLAFETEDLKTLIKLTVFVQSITPPRPFYTQQKTGPKANFHRSTTPILSRCSPFFSPTSDSIRERTLP